MLKKVSISFHLNSPNLTGFGNLKLINSLFSIMGNSSIFDYYISNKFGKNTGFIIKESPFHYPIAKTVLSNSSRRATLTSVIMRGNVKVVDSRAQIGSMSRFIFDVFTAKTNSLLTHKKTIVYVYIDYRPREL